MIRNAFVLGLVAALLGCAPAVDYSGPIKAAVPANASIKGQIVRDASKILPDPSVLKNPEISRVATFADGSQGICVRAQFKENGGSLSSYQTIGITIHNGSLSGNQVNHPLCSRSDVVYSEFPELKALAIGSGSSKTHSVRSNAVSNRGLAEKLAPRDGTFCGDIAHMSAMIMEGRLVGVPISSAMKVFSSNSNSDALFRLIVEEAYAAPAYQTESVRRNAIMEFANKKYVECLRT